MSRSEAYEEYAAALRQGQKEFKERQSHGLNPYPAVLDELLSDEQAYSQQSAGLMDIPIERIAGVKSAGRVTAFTAGFLPLLDATSEFAAKWVALCAAHLSDEGIRDAITCFEYLGNFYVLEGNKRVSVLRHFGAARISASVTRILPPKSDRPEIRAYYEFLEFYKTAKVYDVQFRQPGGYSKLLAAIGKEAGEPWTEAERRSLSAYIHYFKEAFYALGGRELAIAPEEALLVWLRVHSYPELGSLPAAELKKTLLAMWSDFVALAQPDPVEVRTEPAAQKSGLLTKLISAAPEHLNVAFVHMLDDQTSAWVQAHEEGRRVMERELGARVTARSYFHADTSEKAAKLLEQAVEDGAEVLFTTCAQLSANSLKVALRYPKLKVLNCSVDVPYSSIRTYYSRIYEGKFITGALAGAMAKSDEIGYVSAYPILGELASINAFALGAQLTNPRARVRLTWSCLEGNPVTDLLHSGCRVISNRDLATTDYLNPTFGTYYLNEENELVPLASPCWLWGNFYIRILQSIFSGTWNSEKSSPRALNYWWGMRSGVIDVKLGSGLPDGLRALAETLRQGLQAGTIDPFRRRIFTQDGAEINDGTHGLSPEEILHMDYLCSGVDGSIPTFDELLPRSRETVRLLGIHREDIPAEKGAGFP